MRTLGLALLLTLSACSSAEYKKQAYAEQKTSKVMEYDYAVVWKGVKEALSEYKLEEASEEEGRAVTDWAYSTSSQKYIDVLVNGQPRRKHLQVRYKYKISIKRQIIGVLVDVQTEEEVENLSSEGAFKGWSDVDEENHDTTRTHEMLEIIERKILSGRHI